MQKSDYCIYTINSERETLTDAELTRILQLNDLL